MPEIQENIRGKVQDSNNALEIKGNFSWGFKTRDESKDKDEKLEVDAFLDLKNIDLKVKKGEFVCIIGDVGSGKTNLLNAINGELLFVPESSIAQAREEERSADWYDNL